MKWVIVMMPKRTAKRYAAGKLGQKCSQSLFVLEIAATSEHYYTFENRLRYAVPSHCAIFFGKS